MAYDPGVAAAFNQIKSTNPSLSTDAIYAQIGVPFSERVYYQTTPIGFLVENPNPLLYSPPTASPYSTFITRQEDLKTGIFSNPTPVTPLNEGQQFTAQTNTSIVNTITNRPVSANNPTSTSTPVTEPTQYSTFQANLEEQKKGIFGGSSASKGVPTATLKDTQSQQLVSDQVQLKSQQDWRLRLSLAPRSDYLYNAPEVENDLTHILRPLRSTGGIIFPYTPSIQMSYSANYEASELAHTNYRLYNYRNSTVGEITISADFTAQDTKEANYLLAVIHFFKSATKMFYGQDFQPPAGLPPPLCFLTGYGLYGFDQHPVVISTFSYTLPNEVDYIKAGVVGQTGGQNLAPVVPKVQATTPSNTFSNWISSLFRLNSSGLQPGAGSGPPKFSTTIVSNPTYVPTKIQLQLTLLPIISRRAMANDFSVQEYASGKLLRGSINKVGGIW